MVEWVVLGFDQHVKTENRLQQWRIRKTEALDRLIRQMETDRCHG
jgi:hypothetical protein